MKIITEVDSNLIKKLNEKFPELTKSGVTIYDEKVIKKIYLNKIIKKLLNKEKQFVAFSKNKRNTFPRGNSIEDKGKYFKIGDNILMKSELIAIVEDLNFDDLG
jgi:hypothetical protein